MKVDLHIGRLDADSMRRTRWFGFDVILIEHDQVRPPSPAVEKPEIFWYKYDPSSEWNAPIIRIGVDFRYKDFMEHLKSHPNRVKAAVFDLRDLRNGAIPPFILTRAAYQLIRRDIPVLFASGAQSLNELVPPQVLDSLTKFLILHRGTADSLRYRKFMAALDGILRGENYFEAN